MSNKITIRPATCADVEVGTQLLYMTMGRLANYLFGSDTRSNAENVLAQLFVKDANRFSHQFADVAIVNGMVVGLLLAYSGSKMESMKFPMGRQLLGICGLPGLLRFLRRSFPLMGVKEAQADEYFINNLAVLPGFQGKGIGILLLDWGVSKANKLGLTKCSLSVEIGNKPARSLYEHLGYRIVDTFEIEPLHQSIGFAGFHRMVKELY